MNVLEANFSNARLAMYIIISHYWNGPCKVWSISFAIAL